MPKHQKQFGEVIITKTDQMEQKRKYFAFISYSHKDSEMAKWLQHEFEYYKLPATLFEERKDLRKEDLPESFRPVFRDEDELAGGDLKPQISEALADSEYLIVVCSPNSAQSTYVDSEINEFISLSSENKKRIFPFIVDGKPHQDQKNEKDECFPKALLKLSNDKTEPIELIAGDVKASGRDHAFVKILAGTLKEKDIRFTDLWDRYAVFKAEEERKQRDQRDKLLIAQSRFLAEKANALVEEGDSYTARLLALKALPKDLANPSRPIIAEAISSLYNASSHTSAIINIGNKISSMCQSPDGKVLAVALRRKKNNIIIIEKSNGRITQTLKGHKMSINSITFSSNGQYLLTASDDNAIKIWDVRNGNNKEITSKNYHSVRSAIFFDNDEFVLAALNDSSVQIINIKTKEIARRINIDNVRWINCAVSDATDRYIAIACSDNAIRIWDINTNHFITLNGHNNQINSVMFSNDGAQLISASNDNTICLWNVSTWEKLLVLVGHQDAVYSARFSKDDKFIISASKDYTVRIWDSKSGIEVQKCDGHKAPVRWADFSNDCQSVLSYSFDNTIRFWDFSTVNPYIIQEYRTIKIKEATTSINGEYLLVSFMDNSITIFSLKNNQINIFGYIDVAITSCVVSPDAKKIAGISNKGELVSLDSKNGNRLQKFEEELDQRNAYTLQHNINMIRKSDKSRSYSDLFDDDNDDIFNIYERDPIQTTAIAISPDGKVIASATTEKHIIIWNAESGKVIRKFVGQNMLIKQLLFSNDGKKLASLTNKTICIRNIDNWDIIARYQSKDCSLSSIAFNNGGDCIIAVTNIAGLIIWDLKNNKEKHILCESNYLFRNAAFNFDGRKIIAITNDNQLLFWDNESDIIMRKDDRAYDQLLIAFCCEGSNNVITVTKDGVINIIKDIPSVQELIDNTWELFQNHTFTEEERKKYYLD